MRILIINGPNLNLLGRRQPKIYGMQSQEELRRLVEEHGKKLGIDVELVQSNYEGQIIDWIQEANYDGLIINPAAYSHTSIAILDALLAIEKPKIEVHLTNINGREEFRRVKITGIAADRMIMGKHFAGYIEAIDEIYRLIFMEKMVK